MNLRNFHSLLFAVSFCINSFAESNENRQDNYIGKLGNKLDVEFHIENNNGKISGFYYYQKVGIDISITGNVLNQELLVFELDYKNDTVAVIKGTMCDSIISGEWINARTKKSYPLILRKTSHEITPLPQHIEGRYADSNCNLLLTISKIKGEYYYNYVSTQRELKGTIRFSRGIENYLILEGIPYAEDYFDADLPEDSKLAEEYEKLRKQGKRSVGIEGLLNSNEIIIQNYGNSMNYYVKLYECGEKYISLLKQ